VFVTSIHDVDQLVKCTALPVTQSVTKLRVRSGSVATPRVVSAPSSAALSHSPQLLPLTNVPSATTGGGGAVPINPNFDRLFRYTRPPVPMRLCTTYSTLRDPLHRHGAQALELRALEKKGIIQRIHVLVFIIFIYHFFHNQTILFKNRRKLT